MPLSLQPNGVEAGQPAPLPTVWILLSEVTGDNHQCRVLADSLGWPYQEKELRWKSVQRRAFERVSGRRNADEPPGLDLAVSSPLEPPWPDLVMAGSRRSTKVARWIRRQSGGSTRIVKIGNPKGSLDSFALVITAPQFAVPPRPNVLHMTAPLFRFAADKLPGAVAAWEPRFAHLPRPWIAVLIGGPTVQFAIDAGVARRLAEELAPAQKVGGSLLISTSRRTPPPVFDALVQAVKEPRFLYQWTREASENPYWGLLGLADAIVVTRDSALMQFEACSIGKPVFVYTPPVERDWGKWPRRAVDWFMRRHRRRRGQPHSGGALTSLERLQDWLHARNLIRYDRDLDHLATYLIERGFATPFSEFERTVTAPSFLRAVAAEQSQRHGFSYRHDPRRLPTLTELPVAVDRIRALFGFAPLAASPDEARPRQSQPV